MSAHQAIVVSRVAFSGTKGSPVRTVSAMSSNRESWMWVAAIISSASTIQIRSPLLHCEASRMQTRGAIAAED